MVDGLGRIWETLLLLLLTVVGSSNVTVRRKLRLKTNERKMKILKRGGIYNGVRILPHE